MQKTFASRVNRSLNLDYADRNKIWLSNQSTLRKLVGILGMLLPVLLFTFLLIDTNHTSPLQSISHYYFTRANSVFVIVVSLLAIFLLIYKGKETVDFYISSLAGIFALCLTLFPTSNISSVCCDVERAYSITIMKESEFRIAFHYLSAGIFLSCLAYMSAFLFTKSDKRVEERSKEKKFRNKIFRSCAVIMVLALLVIGAGFLEIIPADIYEGNQITFWMETIAVESFGFSWLIKGESFFRDKAPISTA